MWAKPIIFGSLCAVGVAYGGAFNTHSAAPTLSALPASPAVGVRSATEARYQPQVAAPVVQARYARNGAMTQADAASREACPRCVVSY